MLRPSVALLLFALFVTSAPAVAHEYTVGDIFIDHPWARPSTTKTGAVYATFENRGARLRTHNQ
jgi:copper(I)-binding protein